MVQATELPVLLTRSAIRVACGVGDLPYAETRPSCCALPACAAPALSRLQRARHQPVAAHHPAGDFLLGRRIAAPRYGFGPLGCAVRYTLHPRVHGLGLLRVPRQGEARRGLSLMERRTSLSTWPSRIGWLVLIWTASVASLATLSLAFRMLMNLAGLTG